MKHVVDFESSWCLSGKKVWDSHEDSKAQRFHKEVFI